MTTLAPRTFNFGAGNPDPGVFPSRDLGEAARRVIARRGHELAHYPEPRGLPELRAMARERFERNHHVRPPLDDNIPYLRLAFGWIDKGDIADGVRLLAECVRDATPASVPS